ncbi:hypothetical protein ANCCEY_13613 [Ancylostoma ceylanicum]|uniref:PB1 domain-containing protein n=1 Tax=Ancylostoma ceylanicum TaxID=53326 RepID=A0A0D6L763_9BILA|nr:hypothetical protein ANCCEY_13613 [Ancylostoma ceylanicum]
MIDEKKTATIKLYRDNVPRITITYKNKKDLFKQFQKKISEMNLSNDAIYWSDWDNDRSLVKTADDLFAAVENNSTVKMSRSHPEPPSYEHMPWNFASWNFGYGPMPFYYDPRAYGKGRRGRHEKRDHKCCCQDMRKDFANL